MELTVAAADRLSANGNKIRVVSMPCAEVFSAQSANYRQQVLPIEVAARVAVEAAHEDYWWKFVGLDGRVVGMSTFGESAPGGGLKQIFFTVDNVVANVEELLD